MEFFKKKLNMRGGREDWGLIIILLLYVNPGITAEIVSPTNGTLEL